MSDRFALRSPATPFTLIPMNKQEMTEGLLFAGFRLMALALVLTGILTLFFQLAESWYQFDPNYLRIFLWGTLLRPVSLIAVGGGLHLLSARLARRMALPMAS